MVAVVAAATALVATEKFALVAPLATEILAGTAVATGALLDNVTSAPPAGAALLSVSVAVEGVPPVTLAGFNAIALRLAGGGTGVTVRTAVRLTAL